jgi:hypothetical protein
MNTTEPTTALVHVGEQAVAPSNLYDRMAATEPLTAIERMGTWLARSKLLGIDSVEQGCVIAMTCMQERITPLEFRRRYHVIKGTPSMRADYMQASFQSCGGRVRWIRTDDQVAEVEVTHPVHAPEGFRLKVEMSVLRERKLTTEQYHRYPRQMLRARAISEAIRAVMPAINAGEYTPEEQDDYQPRAQVAQLEEATTETTVTQAEQPQSGGLGDRAKKAIAAFKSVGVTREELEWFTGNHKEQIFAEAWEPGDFDRMNSALQSIKGADLAGRAKTIKRLFHPEPDAPSAQPEQMTPPPGDEEALKQED